MLRQPIVAMMGHVDHGKTSVLDSIRGTAVAAKEAGGITQAIGASIIPLKTINAVAGPLLKQLNLELKVPGLLFIDTPGHAAFTNLRKRGGNLADIAVLVIDVMQGIQPQTKECIDILRHYKTPFVIALNKVDLIDRWRSGNQLLQSFQKQPPEALAKLDTKLYEVVGKIFECGFNADRFDRITEHAKQIAMVPVSAKTGEGMPELLMVIAGLAQRFLTESLKTETKDSAKGTVLEVKEDKGIGTALDAIIYDGSLHVGDEIVVVGPDGPLTASVKALFLPDPCCDMRDKRAKFTSVKKVAAATGVRISAPGAELAIAGMPLRAATPKTRDAVIVEVAAEVAEVLVETDDKGVVVKADTLGSLEALLFLLREAKIQVRKASVGRIGKQDIASAESMKETDPTHAVILGFNVPPVEAPVKIITSEVIYQLIEDYTAWMKGDSMNRKKAEREKLPFPARIILLKGYVFRQSNPAVCGVEVQAGKLKTGIKMMKKDGVPITALRGMQKEQENVALAQRNDQLSASFSDVIIGRQLFEGDVLYTVIDEPDFRALKDVRDQLSEDEREVLREIAIIMREKNPLWGV